MFISWFVFIPLVILALIGCYALWFIISEELTARYYIRRM